MATETVPAGAAGIAGVNPSVPSRTMTPGERASLDDQPLANPVYELGRTAFDLWALLNATASRIDKLAEAGDLDDEGVSEVLRLIRICGRMAHDLGADACDMAYLGGPSMAQGAAA